MIINDSVLIILTEQAKVNSRLRKKLRLTKLGKRQLSKNAKCY